MKALKVIATILLFLICEAWIIFALSRPIVVDAFVVIFTLLGVKFCMNCMNKIWEEKKP